MKFLAITLLAVCLIQGNNAQFGSLRNLVSGAVNTAQNAVSSTRSAVSNAVSNVASAASDRASGVLSGALDTASSIRNSLPGGAQALIDSATADISVDSLTAAANNLAPNDLLQTINGAADEVKTIASGVQSQIEETINSVNQLAEEAVSKATSNRWTAPVKAILEKAVEAGVDVKDCTAASVAESGDSAVAKSITCVADKVTEIATLGKNIANVPIRATTLAKDGAVGYNTCRSSTSTLGKRTCQIRNIAPVAVKSALLVKDTISYATQATRLVATLRVDLTGCAAKAVAGNPIQSAKAAAQIVSCVRSKLGN
ncbi:uncharacterized protein LOC117643071 [Thrips palmi]|uniref:Uncharacterized protein LOC117643071 n=1 Tax=Thrips palmi TaxID=161013 RepID=A0A6P8YDA3_THRPL|nr:uncharacterized protein LOC117643071 [Thrips palmi]